ncbi:MAG: hypothetical protein CMJ49_12705 [Planctomycetaceae bacterium]|nr:hypothetical protein [Planctomycetaceae bacterium]
MTEATPPPIPIRKRLGWTRPHRRDWPGLAAVVGVIGLMLIRCLVSFAPRLHWGSEPSVKDIGTMSLTLGPTGAAALDCLAVVVLGLSLWDAALHGRRVHGMLLLLWVGGAIAAGVQGARDMESLTIGGGWVGGLALGLATLHVAQRNEMRRMILAAVVALILPLSVGAIYQGTVQRAQTLRAYEQDKDEIMQSRGWTEESAEFRKYERRLNQFELTGRTGFSNVFGTMMLTLACVAAGVSLCHVRSRDRRGESQQVDSGSIGLPGTRSDGVRAILAGVLALLAGGTLILTFSKGALAACAIATVAAAAAWWVARRLGWGAWWWRFVGFAVLVVGVAAVLLRPQMMGASADGERSLLFRSMYWRAAAAMIREDMASLRGHVDRRDLRGVGGDVIGVGPGRFQQTFLIVKPENCPEEVRDPHNVFLAWTSTLGLGGAAWSVLLIGLLWGVGTNAARAVTSGRDPPPTNEVGFGWVLAIACVVAFGTQYAVEMRIFGLLGVVLLLMMGFVAMISATLIDVGRHENDRSRIIVGLAVPVVFVALLLLGAPEIGMWVIGAAGFVLIVGALARSARMDGQWVLIGLTAAAMGMLLHSQIEMSLTNATSLPLLIVVVGLAASGRLPDAKPKRMPIPWGAMVAWLIAAAMVLVLLIPLARQQWLLGRAADTYRAAQGLRDSEFGPVRDRWLGQADRVAADLTAAQAILVDPHVAQWLARIQMAQLRRRHAAGLITQEAWLEQAEAAIRPIRRLARNQVRPALMYHLEAELRADLAVDTRDLRQVEEAIGALKRMLLRDPYGITAHLDAADLADRLGRPGDARPWYEQALALSERAYLDTYSQLMGEEKARAVAGASSEPRTRSDK